MALGHYEAVLDKLLWNLVLVPREGTLLSMALDIGKVLLKLQE